MFQLDVAEKWYGTGFVRFMSDLKASGQWEPKNNKVHIVQGQISYTQLISQATQEAVAKTNGEWEIAAVTDIQFPVQDWAPVIRALQDTDAGAIMIDHWVAAELAAFAQQYAYDPVPGACPSSYKMGHQSGLSFGGSGLSVGLIMQPAFDVASGDIGLSSYGP